MRFLIDNKKYASFKLLEFGNYFGLDLDGDIIPWRRGQRRSSDFAGVMVAFPINTKYCSYRDGKKLAKESHESKVKNLRKVAQENNKYQWPNRSRKRTYWNYFLNHNNDLFVTGTQIRERLERGN